jgi:phosphate transport system protein
VLDMRATFRKEINTINTSLSQLAEQVERAMSDATVALLAPDAELARGVVEGDRAINERRWTIEDQVVDLIARQQPVATDLRMLIGALRVASELERMGDLACHIGALTLMRFPASAVPDEVREVVAAMGRVANTMSRRMREALADRALVAGMDLDHDDDAMDRLHRELFRRVLTCSPQLHLAAAVDVILLSRYYERYADHAVTVSRQLLFVVNGTGHANRSSYLPQVPRARSATSA